MMWLLCTISHHDVNSYRQIDHYDLYLTALVNAAAIKTSCRHTLTHKHTQPEYDDNKMIYCSTVVLVPTS